MSHSAAEERKLELERKRQRLAEIREAKHRIEEERKARLLAHQQDQGPARDGSPKPPTDEEMEEILSKVGISASTPQISVAEASSDRSGAGSAVSGSSVSRYLGESPSRISPHRSLFGQAAKMENFVKSQVVQVNIAPKEQVSYNKTTQTDVDSGGFREFHTASNEWFEDSPLGVHGGSGSQAGTPGDGPAEVFDPDLSPSHQLARLLPHISLVKPTEVPAKIDREQRRSTIHRDLTEEEAQRIIASDEFQIFFDRTSKIVERALTEDVDIFVDYSHGPDEDVDKTDSFAKIWSSRCFFDEKWSKGRCVSCFDDSPQHPELIVASYNNNEDLPHEPAGVVLVWNSKFKKDTPEYVFYCQSRVTSVAFGRFHPNLILGGTYSGQICLWDNRQNKKTPVQRSPLSANAHTHPVYSLKVVGSQNAHNLISVSTDGKMCSWSLDMLAQPQEALELTWKQSRQVAATCLSFPVQDVNNFLVGSEDGSVYGGSRHGTKAGITDRFEGHFAPVTGIHSNTAVGQVDFSDLFLTSSFDWSVKLWSSKEWKPLHSFDDHNDYVMDVGWSPVHPALFACVDGHGKLELWNLNQDTELPAASVFVEGRPGLNKIMWLPSGQQIAVGDNEGQMWLYDVNETLALPRGDEWGNLSRTLMDIKQARIEAEELAQAMILAQSTP